MTFGVPAEPYDVNPVIERAMRRIFILHADHEQNASTSTVRLAGSSGANPFACIAAGIACLWGPAHGGANEAALNMLREIGTTANIPKYIARAKDKDDPFRLMGFGHRVYKNFDPRAKVMKATADEVLKELNISDPVLDVAKELERIALTTTISSRRSFIPTSISIQASSSTRSASRPTCSRRYSPCAHRRLGRAVERDDLGSRAEDRPSAPALRRRSAARLRAGRQALGARQRQSEARAGAGRAVERHVAAHRTRKPPRNRKAKARARYVRVRALEAFEDPLLVGRCNARALRRKP